MMDVAFTLMAQNLTLLQMDFNPGRCHTSKHGANHACLYGMHDPNPSISPKYWDRNTNEGSTAKQLGGILQ